MFTNSPIDATFALDYNAVGFHHTFTEPILFAHADAFARLEGASDETETQGKTPTAPT
jgi:hypothetical protein